MSAASSNNNNNSKGSNIQAVLVAISIIFSVIFTALNAFWSLANPKDDIKAIESHLQAEISAVETRTDRSIREIKDAVRDLKVESKENIKESVGSVTQRLESINQTIQLQLIELRKQVTDSLTAKGTK